MDQTIKGEHCTFYLGGCWTWDDSVFTPPQCYDSFFGLWSQWCPFTGTYNWSVPGGWLVRGKVQACVNTYDIGRICSPWIYTLYDYQF